MDVGSGALLGRMDRRQMAAFIEGRILQIEPLAGASNFPIPAACRLPLQDQTFDHLAPIRASAPPYSAAGMETFTTARPHADLFLCPHLIA